MRRLATLALCMLTTTLAGCVTMAPHYKRPTGAVPVALPAGDMDRPAAGTAPEADDIPWRTFFIDAKLKAVIEQALSNSRDLRVAMLNVAEARAQYRIQRADLLPTINAQGATSIQRVPNAVQAPGFGGAAGAGASEYRTYSVTAGISNYELDLWGRVRSLSRGALERYLETEEAHRASQISIIAETAINYLTLAADRQRLAVAEQTRDRNLDYLKLTRARFDHGAVSELDVRQAEIALEQARSDIAVYTAQVAQDQNALNLVVGAVVPEELLPAALSAEPPALAELPVGLSSDILLRRPDVLAAEHELKALNADIGAARAAFFPTIQLTGAGGVTSVQASQLFAGGAGTWSFQPTVTLPIFDTGRNIANLSAAHARRDRAIAQYEKAVQAAFRDAADALAQHAAVGNRIAAQEALHAAADTSLTLSQARYERGVDPYLATLTAQLTLYSAEQTLISARLARATNLVTLYRALGGGWK